jgi:DNA-binding NarL/FixJ family response regulator
MNTVRVALVEDDDVIRTLTYGVLSRQPELVCVICAASAEDLLAHMDEALLPQVIILDISLPGMSGLEAIPYILRKLPDVHILMHTVHDSADTIYQALCMGAMGYVLKSTSLPDLKAAVLEVVEGGTPFSRSVSRKVLAHFKPTPKVQSNLLSPREQQVLEALVDGLTNKEIAVRLAIANESVRSHIRNIYHKLQVHSRPALLNRVLRGDL